MENDFREEYEILDWVKMRLVRRIKGLAVILGTRSFVVTGDGDYHTDGAAFFFDAGLLRKDFIDDAGLLCMKTLHMISHCLLGHPFKRRSGGIGDAGDQLLDLEAWELAVKLFGGTPAQSLYVDDHGAWTDASPALLAKWSKEGGMLLRADAAAGRQKQGTARRSLEYTCRPGASRRGGYRAVLKNFAVLREDARPDLESFQYSWYNYGLEVYGKMPLIEPLEYSEDRKIAELVIAIDTSGSCVKDLVQIFLEETKGIMEEENLFFRHFRLHLIQCDNQVQCDDVVTDAGGFTEYIDRLTIRGGGGTDFRPVFDRVGELRQEGELGGLKGLVYFTDGAGRYPDRETDYETVFVMPSDRYDDIDRPSWIRKILFDI